MTGNASASNASTKTYKILLPMKRKSGMSVEAFRDYYENNHVPLAAKSTAALSRYVRRYLDAHPHPETGVPGEQPYDVLTELWFDNEEAFRGTLAYLTTSLMPDEIIEDEKQLFDRSSFRILTTVECDTDLDAVRAALKADEGSNP